MNLGRADEIDLDTRDRFITFINEELIPRYGSLQAVAELAELNPSTAQNYKKGYRFPKVAPLDRIAMVWRKGARAEDLLAYLRSGRDVGQFVQETPEALYVMRIKELSLADKLKISELLLSDVREALNPIKKKKTGLSLSVSGFGIKKEMWL